MRIGIRTSVLFLALAPAILIATLLLIYLTSTRIQDLEQSLVDRGQAIVNQLSPACEYGVLIDNRGILRRLARAVLKEPDVSRIQIKNRAGEKLVDLNQRPTPVDGDENTSPEHPSPLVFEAPINFLEAGHDKSRGPEGDGVSGEASSAAGVIGHVHLELSRETLIERQREVVKTSILLTICCLLLATIFGHRIGRKVVHPILRMENVVSDLRDGNLDARIDRFSSGELGSLERGINAMASSLKASHEHLREQVNEATAELRAAMNALEIKNAELEAAREKAIEVSRIKSEFLANMSHEIRTPMNGVMGFITMLSKTKLKQTQRTYLKTLRASAENLMVILNDILDLSKIEAGKFKIRQRKFDLRDVLEDAVLLFAPNAQQKGLALALDIEPDVPSDLIGDAPRIAQIVTNFVSNAVKFTDRGSVEVSVGKGQETRRTLTLYLRITDTGIGIAAEDQKRLFTAFDQLDNSTSRRQSGTGLGLTISQHLVSMMNGKICVQSRPGEGTVFGVSLMVHKRPSRAKKPTQASNNHGMAIIFATDASLTRALSHILEFHGIKPHCTDDMAKLLELIGSPPVKTEQSITLIIDEEDLLTHQSTFLEKFQRSSGRMRGCNLLVVGASEEQFDHRLLSRSFATVRMANKPPTSRELITLLELPRQPAADATCPLLPTGASPQSVPNSFAAGLKGSITVLLADDNQINRQLARIFLHQLGVQVDEACTGLETLELSRHRSYDLILMDIHMPDMDGLATTLQLRREADNPNRDTPIIALTADALARQQNRYADTGINDQLCKPITEQALQQLLSKWCITESEKNLAVTHPCQKRIHHDEVQ